MPRYYKLLVLSLFLLNLFIWIVFNEDTLGIPKVFKYALSISSLGLLVLYKSTFPLRQTSGWFNKLVIVIFFGWSLVLLIMEGLHFSSFFYLQRVLGQPFFYIPYIIPLIILYTRVDLEFFGYFIHYSYIALYLAIIIQLSIIASGISQFNWSEQVARIGIFDIGGSFLLLTAQLSKKKYVFSVSLIFNLLMIFLYAQFGRRGMMFEYIFLMLAMVAIRLRSGLLNFNSRVKIYFAGLVLAMLIASFGYLAKSTYIFERGGFSKSAVEESRGLVFYDFFYDFNSFSDWAFGRGLEGRVLRTINLEEGTSDIIENGFLTVLLKGGLLYLVPYLLILFRASYLGFFKSNNDLAKALAVLVFLYIIMMMYFNIPTFSSKYIFTWLAASALLSPTIRNYTDQEVYQVINLKLK